MERRRNEIETVELTVVTNPPIPHPGRLTSQSADLQLIYKPHGPPVPIWLTAIRGSNFIVRLSYRGLEKSDPPSPIRFT